MLPPTQKQRIAEFRSDLMYGLKRATGEQNINVKQTADAPGEYAVLDDLVKKNVIEIVARKSLPRRGSLNPASEQITIRKIMTPDSQAGAGKRRRTVSVTPKRRTITKKRKQTKRRSKK